MSIAFQQSPSLTTSHVKQSQAVYAPQTGYVQDTVVQQPEPVADIGSQDRIRYLRKLYFLALLQLVFATWLTHEAWINADFKAWLLENWGFSYVFCLIVVVFFSFVSFLSKSNVAKSPINYVVYVIFFICFAFLFAYFEAKEKSVVDTGYVYAYVCMAGVVVGALFIHNLVAKYELTFQSAALYVVGSVTLLTLLFEIFTDEDQWKLTDIWIVGVFGILWGFYLVWENETVVQGAKTLWSKEDYVTGAVSLYMNVLSLVLHLATLIRQLIIKARS